jgi:hypothetical protein
MLVRNPSTEEFEEGYKNTGRSTKRQITEVNADKQRKRKDYTRPREAAAVATTSSDQIINR